MKIIKYKFLIGEVDSEPILSDVEMGWNETNEETAKREAYLGECTIEDDGQSEPDTASTDDVLNTLLGVTE